MGPRRGAVLWLGLMAAALAAQAARAERYGFSRDVRAGGARRLLGGRPAAGGAFPAACALADRGGRTRCSCAVLAARWALTAAHCLASSLAYVEYAARGPAARAAVHSLYRHPEYKVILEDEGRGPDVTLLHHDVGLVRTRADMVLAAPPAGDPLLFMRKYNAMDLASEEVQVLGFGRAGRRARGGLLAARLRLAPCARASWLHCACAASQARAACAGDSGGPVLYRGAQVGVTSLGPVRCAAAAPAEPASSVFTALYYYVDMLNETVRGAGRMARLEVAAAAPPPAAAAALLLAAVLARAGGAAVAELWLLPPDKLGDYYVCKLFELLRIK